MHPSVSHYVKPELHPNHSLQAIIQQLVELLNLFKSLTVAILTERKKNDVTFRGWRKVRLPVNYFVLITWLHMTSTLDRQCSLYTKRTCSIPEFVQENQWWSPEPHSRYWNQILCYQDQQQFTITGSVPPPKPKWTWTLKLWIPDPINVCGTSGLP